MKKPIWALAPCSHAVLRGAPLAPPEREPATRPASPARPSIDLVKASVDRCWPSSSPRRPVIRAATADIRQLADGLFDFNEMGRLPSRATGRSGPSGAAGVRPLFTALLERSYLSSIENYAGEKITFLNESVSGPYASAIPHHDRSAVRFHRLPFSTPGPVVVYDVVLDGGACVEYRSQFNSIIRTSSFAGLWRSCRTRRSTRTWFAIGRGGS